MPDKVKPEKTTTDRSINGSKVVSRSLPDYAILAEKWGFMRESYLGGKPYVDKHLFKYYIEGQDEYRDRVQRAHRENHCKRIVDLFNSYLFQEKPDRATDDKALSEFHESIDGGKLTLDQFMKQVSLWSSVFGRLYVMVDRPTLDDEERTGTAADSINPKAQPYCYLIHPQDIKDIAYNEDGTVRWVIIEEHRRDDRDPFDSTGDIIDEYRLWTVDEWFLFDDRGNLIDGDGHGLGLVPMVVVDNEDNNDYDGQSLIDDIAYLDRAIFNNWSRLDAIVCDQTFSQLIFPIEGMIADVIKDEKLREQFLSIATNRILLYSAQAQVPPAYISPDASQAQFILTMIESQTKQLYASLGLKADVGTDAKVESGVAKAWDFHKLNKMLANKADNLEACENDINLIFARWMGQDEIDCMVDYPDNFDVRTLMDEIAMAQELALLRISETFDKEVQKILAAKVLPKVDDEIIEKIFQEIDDRQPQSMIPKTPTFDFDKDQNDDDDDDDDDEDKEDDDT